MIRKLILSLKLFHEFFKWYEGYCMLYLLGSKVADCKFTTWNLKVHRLQDSELQS